MRSPLSTTWREKPGFTVKPPTFRPPIPKPGISGDGVLGQLWPGNSQSKLADLCCVARPSWIRQQRHQKTGTIRFCLANIRAPSFGRGLPTPFRICSRPRPGWEKEDAAARELLRLADRRFATKDRMMRGWSPRIRSYELARQCSWRHPRLWTSPGNSEVLDLYGIQPPGTPLDREINIPEEADAMGRKCLVARRFLERGVRFCSNLVRLRQWVSSP